MNLGPRPSEQLLWSFHNVLAAQTERQQQQAPGANLALDVDPRTGYCYIWMHSSQAGGAEGAHLVHRSGSVCVGGGMRG